MKVFISQSMNGLSDDEILEERELLIKLCKDKFGEHTEILDSWFGDEFDESECKNKGLLYLAKSLQVMADADAVVLSRNWGKARGCIIEKNAANKYGIRVYELSWSGDYLI